MTIFSSSLFTNKKSSRSLVHTSKFSRAVCNSASVFGRAGYTFLRCLYILLRRFATSLPFSTSVDTLSNLRAIILLGFSLMSSSAFLFSPLLIRCFSNILGGGGWFMVVYVCFRIIDDIPGGRRLHGGFTLFICAGPSLHIVGQRFVKTKFKVITH